MPPAASSFVRTASLAAAVPVLAGFSALAWSLYEARSYRLRQIRVPVLPAGQRALRVLHLSDLHLVPDQLDKRDWISALVRLEPEAVVVTGDFLAHRDAVPAVLDTLEPLFHLPGAFVLGSNDYFEPRPLNPLRYLLTPSSEPKKRPLLPWRDLVAGLTAAGWLDLNNATGTWAFGQRAVSLRGVDDPHIRRDRYGDVAGPYPDGADLRLGVTHAPYLRVLDAMTADSTDLMLAGHTHGGQVCVPGYGALVTNCDLDRRRAKGLSRHPGADGQQPYLHVSAGLGTSPYAPIRFACPPEATLLDVVASS